MSEPTLKPDQPPVPPATPFTSFGPVTLTLPWRPVPMQMRVAFPATGGRLPILLLSHGHGASGFLASMRGYGPLVDFYASHGFVVIQPTHLNSRTLALDPGGPEGALFWRSRARDMHCILDHLDEIEAAVPGLQGRLDRERIAAIGHSLGAHTVAMLAGMTVVDSASGELVDLAEPRIRTAVMVSPPGDPADRSAWLREHLPELSGYDFGAMALPSLVVTGDQDFSERFSERRDWRADAYRLSPGPKCLLTLPGAGHLFGGISGYDAKETSDESPERVAALQRITWAYLRTRLCPEDPAWHIVRDELNAAADPAGHIECRQLLSR